MGRDVWARPTLATSLEDRRVQGLEAADDARAVHLSAETFALIGELAEPPVAPGRVAPSTCGDLVFEPTGTALDSRDKVLGGRHVEPLIERASTPHAVSAVSFQDEIHASPTVEG